ncbi:MAG: efflux RND transporter periplasmic adaptor subunit [Sphingomonas sp.]
MTRFLPGLATMAATALLAAFGGAPETQAVKTPAPAGPRYKVALVETGDWRPVSAEITTVDQAQLIARIPGILATLSVHAGDVVRKGQVVGRIVDTQLSAQSAAFGAQATGAQAVAAQAQAEFARTRYLYENGVYAKARLDQAQSAMRSANAQIRAAQAQQAAVAAVAGQGAVVAPAQGRVLRADIPAGAAVAPGMVIATITSGPTVLRLTLPESLAGQVHAGARVRASGIGATSLGGTVVRVYPSVQSGQIVADVAMDGIDNKLVGRRVAAEVETGTRRAFIVGQSYVTRAYGIDMVRVVAADGSMASLPVQTTPASEAGKVEILSGINAGDTLVGSAAQ